MYLCKKEKKYQLTKKLTVPNLRTVPMTKNSSNMLCLKANCEHHLYYYNKILIFN